MGKEVIFFCDMRNQKCKGDVSSWRIVPPAGKLTRVVDLCEYHAAPLAAAVEQSRRDEALPARPKRTMKATPVKGL